MTEWMFAVSDGAAGCVRIVLGLCLIGVLLQAKRLERDVCLAGLLGAAIIGVVAAVFGLPMFYRAAIEILWLGICAVRFLKADIRMSLFVAVFCEIGVSLWCFLITAGFGMLWGAAAMPEHASVPGQAAVWAVHLLLAAAVVWILRQEQSGGAQDGGAGWESGGAQDGNGGWESGGAQDDSAKRIFGGMQTAVLLGFLGIVALSQQTRLSVPSDTLDTWLILSLVLLMAVLVFRLRRQYEMERELARLKAEQAELLERDYTALNRVYAANAKLFHDFRNHIGVMRQLLAHQKYDEAQGYLDKLQAPIREMIDTVWTADETVDYLINSKMQTAAEAGVSFTAQVEFPRHTNIESADMCAILGNLLDNALEAARQVAQKEQRSIELTIRRINQMLVIKVENTYSGRTVSENGSLKTTKTDGGLHGWGLKSAKTAAEKYDGMVRISCGERTFRAVVTLSYQGVE